MGWFMKSSQPLAQHTASPGYLPAVIWELTFTYTGVFLRERVYTRAYTHKHTGSDLDASPLCSHSTTGSGISYLPSHTI